MIGQEDDQLCLYIAASDEMNRAAAGTSKAEDSPVVFR